MSVCVCVCDREDQRKDAKQTLHNPERAHRLLIPWALDKTMRREAERKERKRHLQGDDGDGYGLLRYSVSPL